MTGIQKRYFFILMTIAILAFSLFALPNSRASENISMVQMFQPDEAAPLPYVFKMIAPAESLNKALHSFIFYEYYYYGFPYFGSSALVLLPLQWLGCIGDMSLVMFVLRQFISVLPTLIALLLLVYMQDGFRTYRSPILFGFLLLVPAVVSNNLWWHPDGIVLLTVILMLFFLERDRLRFGRNFLFAAILTGVATATKLVGLYFFLAVGLTLVLGLIKKVPVKRLVLMSVLFLVIMVISFVAANPFLLSGWGRTAYLNIMNKEAALLEEGYGVVYQVGLGAAYPIIQRYYGGAFLILLSLAAAVIGAWRGSRRLLNGLILAWFVPLTVMILVVTHFKFQYFMPVALPLFSCLILLLPEKWQWKKEPTFFLRMAALAGLIVQAGVFISADVQEYATSLHRAENNERITFYSKAVNVLQPLQGKELYVYYDYRLYVPGEPGWSIANSYDLLDYKYIQQNNFDVLLLLQQRINDYLNPDVTGIDPQTFALNQQFYRDADKETLVGYHLVNRDAVGLVYVRDDLYQQFFLK